MVLEHEQEFEYVKLEIMRNAMVVFQQALKTVNATVKRVQVHLFQNEFLEIVVYRVIQTNCEEILKL